MDREYPVGYVWNVHDADTLTVLVPADEQAGIWKLIRVRVRGLYAPELSTPDGKRLTDAVASRLLRRWTKVSVTTGPKSYDRYVGTVKMADGMSYVEMCKGLMEDMGIGEGGRGIPG